MEACPISLVKNSHNVLFKTLTDNLRSDIGRSIIIETRSTTIDCPWCDFDQATGRSSGIPSAGKDWSTHPNYVNSGSGLRCPNCSGKGVINLATQTTINNVLIFDEQRGIQFIHGKLGIIPEGTKRLIGKLADTLLDTSDINGKTYFHNATKIIVDGDDYRVKSIKKFGLKDLYLFDVTIQRSEIMEENPSALST